MKFCRFFVKSPKKKVKNLLNYLKSPNFLSKKKCGHPEFSYEGMYARTQLAVMDHNFNLSRKQALTKNNEPRSKFNFSKVTTNWAPKKVLEPKSRMYITEIVDEISKLKVSLTEINDKLLEITKNIATTPNPGKEKELALHKSRFTKSDEDIDLYYSFRTTTFCV